MNTRLLFFLSLSLVFGTYILPAQQVIFVKPGQNGDGSSWDKATNDLQTALRKAHNGTQIWVAAGIFTPTSGTDRTISFNIPSGVKMYGGFAGQEKGIGERQIGENKSILSGEIGSNEREDNSFNVIFTKFVNAETTVDGFTITGGFANGKNRTSNRERSGGGWYNDGGNKTQSNPNIVNCEFIENFAKDGGAFYNLGRGGEALPKFVDCTFDSNSSDLDGGAVYNDGREKGKANSTFTHCVFENNKGNYGGAVFNYGLNGEAYPKYERCVFSANMAYVKGGGIFHLSEKPLDRAIFGTTNFNNNSALDHDSDDIHHFFIAESQVAAN